MKADFSELSWYHYTQKDIFILIQFSLLRKEHLKFHQILNSSHNLMF